MNERDKARNVFGNGGSGASSLSNLTSDMWTPISGTKQPQNTNRAPVNPQSKKNTSQNSKNVPSKTNNKKQSKPYVSSDTGLKGQQKKADNSGRISGVTPGKKAAPPKNSKSMGFGNIFSSSDNNKNKAGSMQKKVADRNTSRAPQSRKGAASDTNSIKMQNRSAVRKEAEIRNYPQLTKREKETLRKDREMYEKSRKDGMSNDEIRRAAQLKKLKKRKAGMMVTFGAFILTLVLLLGGYIYYEGAIIENIAIEGKSRYSASEIIEASSVETGDNLFGVREKDVREKLTNDLPYIKDVSVKFKLPDTVVITVSATNDKILIVNKNKYLRLDTDGKVLSVSKTKMKDGMFRVDGLIYKKAVPGDIYIPDEKDEERYEAVKQIITVAETVAGLTSGVINVTDLKDITVIYDSRIKIYLGTTDDLESKLSLAMRTIKEAAPDKQTGYVDMRFSKMGYFSEGKMDNK